MKTIDELRIEFEKEHNGEIKAQWHPILCKYDHRLINDEFIAFVFKARLDCQVLQKNNKQKIHKV